MVVVFISVPLLWSRIRNNTLYGRILFRSSNGSASTSGRSAADDELFHRRHPLDRLRIALAHSVDQVGGLPRIDASGRRLMAFGYDSLAQQARDPAGGGEDLDTVAEHARLGPPQVELALKAVRHGHRPAIFPQLGIGAAHRFVVEDDEVA